RLPEEKRRGMTIDIGFASLQLGPLQLGIVDVPGHERFIKNMLAGAAGVDIALLIVAADDSVMPQTREHLAILQLLDIRHGLIAITKCDRADQNWLELVEDEIRQLTAGTFLEAAPIVRTAVPNDGPAQGLPALRDAIASVCQQVVEKWDTGLFRMPIDRAFTVPGLGTVVTGTVWSGQLSVRDEVEWLPAAKQLVVRGLQNHGLDTPALVRGQRAAINLTGVHPSEIARGHEVAIPGYLVPAKMLTVELQVLGDSARAVKHRSRQRLYLGAQHVMVTVALLEDQALEPGSRGLAQLHCAEPVVAVSGQPFVLRAESPLSTMGGGRIIQPRGGRISRRQPDRIERLKELLSTNDAVRAAAAIYFYETQPWTLLDLCRDASLSLHRCGAVVEELEAAGTIVKFVFKASQESRVHREILHDWEQRVLRLVDQLHAQFPLSPTVSRDRVTALDRRNCEATIVPALIDRLIERGALHGDQQAVALAGFSPRLSQVQQRLRERLLGEFQAAGYQPPTPVDLAQATSSSAEQIREMLDLCVAEGQLVHLTEGWYLHADVAAMLRSQLRAALSSGPGLTVREIRELLGTQRKFAVPICEYLDRIGFTRRVGDLRLLR
ncbi:MAG: selenocysteine-specific translation elongation factor, partial [Pirellulales bacterium]